MVNGEFSVRRVVRYCRAGLHRHMVLAADLEPVLPYILCLFEGRIRVAPFNMPGNVNITLKAFMDFRRLFLNPFHWFVNRGQHFVVDLDQVKGLLRNVFR